LRSTRSTSSLLLLLLSVLLTPAARAQWETVTYHLHGGWNAIYLHGDATYATPDVLFSATPFTGNTVVQEVWRWNPNPTQTQFEASPLVPNAGTPEWSVWTRGATTGNTLASLTGQTAYLVRCSGTATDNYDVQMVQKPLPPRSVWVRNGANLLGFPAGVGGHYPPSIATASAPTFPEFFATFPAAVATNTRLYKYGGGELGPGNPVQIYSPAGETIDRNQAYWFESPLVGTFYGPVEISPSNLDGLSFGRAGTVVSVRVRNRTSSIMRLMITPYDSDARPANQPEITGPVPLLRRVYTAGNPTPESTLISAGYPEVINPLSSVTLEFGIDRNQMTGAAGALYASRLRFRDVNGANEPLNLVDITLPATALVGTLAGLWVGDVSVTNVRSNAPGSPGSTTARPAPLRTLLHIDDAGIARLLSEVFIGKLNLAQTPLGLCTTEGRLLGTDKATAARLTAVHLPPGTVLPITPGGGSVAVGSSITRAVTIGFKDATNPFVHTYHPDHDNKDARGQQINEPGIESYTIVRTCTFTFTSVAPILAGTYTETITGLVRDPRPATTERPLEVTGTFQLRRVSEIGDLQQN